MMSAAVRLRVHAAVFCCLLALSLQIWAHIVTSSPTFDEPYHITRAYIFLRTGDQALLARGGHPHLGNMLSVTPLLLLEDLRLPPHEPGWPQVRTFKDLFAVADTFFWRLGNDVDQVMIWSRFSGLLLAAFLGLAIFLWAKQLYGTPAGLLSLLFFTFDPNIVAHSGLVTTDLGGTLFIFLALYSLWRFCQRPSWSRLVATGVVLGMAQASKFSALFLIPTFVVLLAAAVTGPEGPKLAALTPGRAMGGTQGRRLIVLAGVCIVMFLVGGLVVWATYGFDVRYLVPPKATHPVLDRYIPANIPQLKAWVYAIAEHLPVPAPSYWGDLAWLVRYARAGHASFLAGLRGVEGWWYYFPIAFAIKTPIPTLLALGIAAVFSLRNRGHWRRDASLWLPMWMFAVVSISSSIDIGYRNLLPILPLAFVLVGQLATVLCSKRSRVIGVLLGIWLIAGTLRIAPHYLAYFNEAVGGPANGYRYLVDSNLDWGQDLKNLKRYADARGIDQVHLSYFGTCDPAYYGLNALPMPTAPPAEGSEPAYYAISATNLQSVYGSSKGDAHWLSRYTAVDTVGYSILIYRLPQ